MGSLRKEVSRILECIGVRVQAFLSFKKYTHTQFRNSHWLEECRENQHVNGGGWCRNTLGHGPHPAREIIPHMAVYVSAVCWGLGLVLSNFFQGSLSQFKIILWAIYSITCFSKIYHNLISIWICSLRGSLESPFLKFQLSTSCSKISLSSWCFKFSQALSILTQSCYTIHKRSFKIHGLCL